MVAPLVGGEARAAADRLRHVTPAGNVRHGRRRFMKSYRRTAFEDAWTRYGVCEPLQRNNVNESGPESRDSEPLHTGSL